MSVPLGRIRVLNDAPISNGRYVLYWMIGSRRTRSNFALQHAAAQAREQRVGLVVLEALRSDYTWASARHHRFVVDGMRDNALALRKTSAVYFPYIEPTPAAGRGLLTRLANEATLVVTDDTPTFFLREMVYRAAASLSCPLVAVDSNGILPISALDRTFTTAHSFRASLQKSLHEHLDSTPRANPLAGLALPRVRIDADIRTRWKPVHPSTLARPERLVTSLPIDQAVAPTGASGGSTAAHRLLATFVASGLTRYDDDRNQPQIPTTSGLSPFLHYGHISSQEILGAVARAEGIARFDPEPTGKGQREGWWNVSSAAESFLDQVVTWRELGFNRAHREGPSDTFDSLPEWAQQTLALHSADPRPYVYNPEELELARTHDELWNAAQRQLVREGTIHNYLRMLWGKKILEWTETPELAMEVMLHLNNKYALDGRDPNSVSGIAWVLGRYDRAWGPERPVFGKVRYMSSTNTARKVRVREYLERYGEESADD